MVRDGRSSLFCPYKASPAILDKTSVVPIVDKSHRCVLTIKTQDSSKDYFVSNSYLTKCGRFVIFTKYRPSYDMAPKVLIVERCNSQLSQHVIPIIEMRIEIYPYVMLVSPNEKFIIIYEEPTSTRPSLIFNLYKLDLSKDKATLMKFDSLVKYWPRGYVLTNVCLTDNELIVLYNDSLVSIYDISQKFSLTEEQNGIGCSMKSGYLMVQKQQSTLSVYFPNTRTGKAKKRIIDKNYIGYVGNREVIETTQIYPYHLQKTGSIFYAIASCVSVQDSKIYIVEIEGSNLNVLKTVILMDVVKEVFGDNENDDNGEEKLWDIPCISINPYTCDCYVMVMDDIPIEDNEEPLVIDEYLCIDRHRLFCFNLFSSGRKHILDISDLHLFDAKMSVNWASNELIIIDGQGQIVGYQLPLSNFSLQLLAKRAVMSLYKPEDILNLDISRHLRKYVLY